MGRLAWPPNLADAAPIPVGTLTVAVAMRDAAAFGLVFFGGGLGATLRYAVTLLASRVFGNQFPAGTLAINVSGSVLIGVLAVVLVRDAEPGRSCWIFFATGVLGGYTTFSAFALDAVLLWDRGASASAALYVFASVAMSIGGCLIGLWLGRQLA